MKGKGIKNIVLILLIVIMAVTALLDIRAKTRGSQESDVWSYLNANLESKTINGVEFALSGDSFVVSGTNTSDKNTTYTFANREKDDLYLDPGTYRISGCPEGGGDSSYRIWLGSESNAVVCFDTGDGVTFDVEARERFGVLVDIAPGVTVNNLVITPTITKIESAYPINGYPWYRIVWIVSLIFILAIIQMDALFSDRTEPLNTEASVAGQKSIYISAMNVVAALGVVFLHTNGAFWSNPRPVGRLWLTTNFIETFCYWPVPVFYMITGATLMEYRKRYDTSTFLKKRVKKTFIPYIAWSLFACAFNVLYQEQAMDWNILHIIQNIFNSKYMQIYWFFPPLFAIYLSIPVLSAIEGKIQVFRYAILSGVVTISVLPLVCNLLGISYNGALQVPVAAGSLFFAMAGYYINKTEINRKSRIVIYICGFIGWLMQFLGTMMVSANETTVIMTFKGYSNLPSFLQAVAVFVFFKYLLNDKKMGVKTEKAIYWAASLTSGIYLVHLYLLIVLIKEFSIDNRMIVWRTCGAVAVFIASGIIIALLKKIPGIRRLVP